MQAAERISPILRLNVTDLLEKCAAWGVPHPAGRLTIQLRADLAACILQGKACHLQSNILSTLFWFLVWVD